MNINEQKIDQIINDIVYLEEFNFFKNYTLPSMLRNKFAPAYGWSADFRDKKEYINFINNLYRGDECFTQEYIIKYLIANIDNYYENKDELIEDIEWFEGIEFVAEEIFMKLSMEDIIDIMAEKVEDDIKNGRLDQDIQDYFDCSWDLFCYEDKINSLKNDSDMLMELIKKYGF